MTMKKCPSCGVFRVKKKNSSIRIDDDAWAYVNGHTIQIFRNPKKGENVICIRLTQRFLKEACALTKLEAKDV